MLRAQSADCFTTDVTQRLVAYVTLVLGSAKNCECSGFRKHLNSSSIATYVMVRKGLESHGGVSQGWALFMFTTLSSVIMGCLSFI